MIRTGGDYRTSNFMPWQSTYAELFFINKVWPEIEKKDLELILDQYQNRERRFGI